MGAREVCFVTSGTSSLATLHALITGVDQRLADDLPSTSTFCGPALFTTDNPLKTSLTLFHLHVWTLLFTITGALSTVVTGFRQGIANVLTSTPSLASNIQDCSATRASLHDAGHSGKWFVPVLLDLWLTTSKSSKIWLKRLGPQFANTGIRFDLSSRHCPSHPSLQPHRASPCPCVCTIRTPPHTPFADVIQLSFTCVIDTSASL